MCVRACLCVCPSARPLQVQSAGLPLPERRHHAKPTVWCNSLFQRPLLQVLKLCNVQVFPWPFMFYLEHIFTRILVLLSWFALKCFHHSRVVAMFATGEGILTQKDGVTADGLQEVFTTNLFGHFLLVSDSWEWSEQIFVWVCSGDASRLFVLPFVARKVLTFDRHDCHSAVILIKI